MTIRGWWSIFIVACGAPAAQEVTLAPRATAAVVPMVPKSPTVDAPSPNGCIVLDEAKLGGTPTTLEGKVMCGEAEHPNGTTFSFCLVLMDAPRCVEGSSTVKEANAIQLAGIDFSKLADQRVRVHGSPFPQHTAWHVQPVLMLVDRFEPL